MSNKTEKLLDKMQEELSVSKEEWEEWNESGSFIRWIWFTLSILIASSGWLIFILGLLIVSRAI